MHHIHFDPIPLLIICAVFAVGLVLLSFAYRAEYKKKLADLQSELQQKEIGNE